MPGTSTEQVVDKGIRQKSTKEWTPFTHSIPFTHSLTAVPFVRGHRSVFPRTPRNTGVYTRHPTFVTATSGVLTRLPAKLSKNRMRVYTLSDRRSKKKLHVYTASEAKGLKGKLKYKHKTTRTQWLCKALFIVHINANAKAHSDVINRPGSSQTAFVALGPIS